MVITNRSLSEAPVKAPEQEVWLEFKSQDPKVRNIFKLDAVACTVIENTRSFPTFHLSKNVNLLKEENTMHRYLLHSAGNQSQGLLHARNLHCLGMSQTLLSALNSSIKFWPASKPHPLLTALPTLETVC
ncbi:uncharacterized protein RHO17_005864 isoform 2-T2 [Thomomys bottae]